MSSIKIKNFGPIKEGYQEDDGFMEIKKVTVLIGNQGSGKSTVAKVLSTLTWLEKAFNRGDYSGLMTIDDFKEFFNYQSLGSYFKPNTIIGYRGDVLTVDFNPAELPINTFPSIKINYAGKYIVPKIMYVPTERNFLTVIKNATNIKGLPYPLFEFAEELKLCQNEFIEKDILLPVNEEVFYKYDANSDSSFIEGDDFNINLLAASSGFQSLVPLFLVSFSLSKNIHAGSKINPRNISVAQNIRMNSEIGKVMRNSKLENAEKIEQVNVIQARFQNKSFINIVEEPELSLFPSSQHELLNSLLEFNNMNEGNKLIITTHSPYLINFLTLAVEANKLKDKVNTDELKSRLSEIVPFASMIDGADLVVYQLNEKDGLIEKLKDYKGIPSDENYLNEGLAKSNEDFSKLLEIEDLCR